MIRTNIYNAPRCPACGHGLSVTFNGHRRIPCPECGSDIAPTDASYAVNRWLFVASSVAASFAAPTYLFFVSAGIAYSRANHVGADYGRTLAFSIIAAVAFHASAGAYTAHRYILLRKYLVGPYLSPPGWAISSVILAAWTLTTGLLALVLLFWGS
jgi:predicted RNA-binding Zn-ribbon protein involved in translation (DUF1610 family)